jgi:hypothetical protein
MGQERSVDVWGLLDKVLYVIVVASFVWVWKIEGRVTVLETQRQSTIEKITKIDATVEKIYDLLLEDARKR